MMGGMISGMMKRKPRSGKGVPLTALTPQARAAGNHGLDEDQQAIIAAWLSLPKAQQRAAVIDAMEDGRGELTMADLPGAAPEESPAEEAVEAEPVQEAGGGATVVPDGQWSPEEENPTINPSQGD